MNKIEQDIMKILIKTDFKTQRLLAEISGYSIGMVNKCIKNLQEKDYLNENLALTLKAKEKIEEKKPKNAIILAAGYGMRMVPINTEVSKGLIEIDGEPLIERLIKQLQEVDITDIYVVVGYMKEQYEYLIDLYNVKLIVNMEYSTKNNLHTLLKAVPYLSNSYIVPCDLWCEKNPFSRHELYSWYMVSNRMLEESTVRVNRKFELVSVHDLDQGNRMIGICYLVAKEAKVVESRLLKMAKDRRYDNSFWEETLYNESGKMLVWATIVDDQEIIEINTYEQLRQLDDKSEQLNSVAINVISEVLMVESKNITDITVLKKGMTNRSFLFSCKNKRYIMRIPGEGTDQLINRNQEAAVYEIIKDTSVSDEIIYHNGVNGYKITRYIEDAHTCDPHDFDEVKHCMNYLKQFHEMKLKVDHYFDIFGQIQYYEDLRENTVSIYRDYDMTKMNILSLKPWIDQQEKELILTHIDAVPDNFLFYESSDGQIQIRLIDWEYAGMQDPHVDIAMFCIYAMYDKKEVDKLIDLYFENTCSQAVRIKIYAYIASCGLLWSNWCEYKRKLGIEFGEYAMRQYRYAKEYYKIVQQYINEGEAR